MGKYTNLKIFFRKVKELNDQYSEFKNSKKDNKKLKHLKFSDFEKNNSILNYRTKQDLRNEHSELDDKEKKGIQMVDTKRSLTFESGNSIKNDLERKNGLIKSEIVSNLDIFENREDKMKEAKKIRPNAKVGDISFQNYENSTQTKGHGTFYQKIQRDWLTVNTNYQMLMNGNTVSQKYKNLPNPENGFNHTSKQIQSYSISNNINYLQKLGGEFRLMQKLGQMKLEAKVPNFVYKKDQTEERNQIILKDLRILKGDIDQMILKFENKQGFPLLQTFYDFKLF